MNEIRVRYPLDKIYEIKAGFGKKGTHWKTFHKGIDYAAPKRTPVYAAEKGTVCIVGVHPDLGKRVWICHKKGKLYFRTGYFHLDEIVVKEEQGISKGDLI